MKKFNFFWMFFLCLFLLGGCKNEDLIFSVDALKGKLVELDEQVNAFNENLKAMAYVLDSNNKTIKSVVMSEDGKSYVITLSDETELTITVGSELIIKQPEITIDDETKCWVINGVSTGKKAEGNDGGYGSLPQFKFSENKWWVDFGNGNWEEVQGGGAPSGTGSDLFSDAKIKGDVFVVTLNGIEYKLPIIPGLTCAFNDSDVTGLNDDGFYEIHIGETKEFDVKIDGDPEILSPIYPLGWYAELSEKETIDEDGYNYTLKLSAQYFNEFASRSISSDNLSDVAIRVRKGSYWLTDKVRVKMRRVAGSFYEDFMDGYDININGYSFNKDGLITNENEIHVISSNTTITAGGIYFYNSNDINIDCDLSDKMGYLVVLPYTNEYKANFNIKQNMNISNVLVLKNLKVAASSNVNKMITLKAKNSNIAINNCIISGLSDNDQICNGYSSISPMKYFGIHDTDIIFETSSQMNDDHNNISGLYNISCDWFDFSNNVCYNKSDYTVSGFKLYNGKGLYGITKLTLLNNTFIDLEGSDNSNTGFLNLNELGEADLSNNLIWIEKARNSNNAIIRYTNKNVEIAPEQVHGSGNHAYNVSKLNDAANKTKFQAIYGASSIVDAIGSEVDFFDTTKGAEFKKDEGIFKPVSEYAHLGAQR